MYCCGYIFIHEEKVSQVEQLRWMEYRFSMRKENIANYFPAGYQHKNDDQFIHALNTKYKLFMAQDQRFRGFYVS